MGKVLYFGRKNPPSEGPEPKQLSFDMETDIVVEQIKGLRDMFSPEQIEQIAIELENEEDDDDEFSNPEGVS